MTAQHPQEHMEGPITITVLYDNHPFDERLRTNWGFSALIEDHDQRLLFDTGGDSPTLLINMGVLGIDPMGIETIVLSHAHGDHTGGLEGLLRKGPSPTVYLPPSFSASYKRNLKRQCHIEEVTPGQAIGPGAFTTGELGKGIQEQALVLRTPLGLVLITGCAHPGIVKMIERAKSLFNDRFYLVMGGFHLRSKNTTEIKAILSEFRQLGVEKAAPSHCTGKQAIAMFEKEYGEDFVRIGAGKIISLEGDLHKKKTL